MEYNQVIVKFCERKLFPYRPEYLNAFSALYISTIGYYNLLKISRKSLSLSLIYWCICMNGFASFFYHFTGWYFFKLLDEFTMIIPIWIGIVRILQDLNYSKNYIGLISAYNIILLVLDVFMWFDNYFPIAFALELSLIFPLYYQIINLNKHSTNTIIRKYSFISNKGFKGILITCTSAYIWIITECYCNIYFIFGHPIWHIGMSTGICYIIQYFYEQTKLIRTHKHLS